MPVDEEGVNNFFQKMGAKSNRLQKPYYNLKKCSKTKMVQ